MYVIAAAILQMVCRGARAGVKPGGSIQSLPDRIRSDKIRAAGAQEVERIGRSQLHVEVSLSKILKPNLLLMRNLCCRCMKVCVVKIVERSVDCKIAVEIQDIYIF